VIDGRIKYRHLQCFLEVARQKSLVRAADSLAISQPAVSKTIRELEDILGVRLFDRNRKATTVTRSGEIFHRHAGMSIASLQQGLDGVAQVSRGGGARVNVGVLPNAAAVIMPRAILACRAQGIGAAFRVMDGSNPDLLGQLKAGELDFVVGRLAEPVHMVGLSFEHLYSESLAFGVRPEHPLLAEENFELSRILDYPVMLPIRGSSIRYAAESFLIASGVGVPNEHIETISVTFGRTFTRASNAIWIMDSGVMMDDLQSGVLARLPVDAGATQGPVGLTTRVDSTLSGPAEMLMNAVREVAGAFRTEAAE
jgi:LysR family pca operon transcriptional activator